MDATQPLPDAGRPAPAQGRLVRGVSALRQLSERVAFPSDSLVLLALLLLANLLRIHFPGGLTEALFGAVVLFMGLTLLRRRIQPRAWPVLLCFAALLVLYVLGLVFAFSLQGVRHWIGILMAGVVFLFCHQNGPALLRSKGIIPVLLLAVLGLLPLYMTGVGINPHTFAAISGYLLLAIGLVLVAGNDDGRRQHWWAHLFFALFVANGILFGHRSLVGGLLLAYPLYWAGRYFLRGLKGAGLLAAVVAALVWLIVAAFATPQPTGAVSYINSIFSDYTGGKAKTGREALWSASLAGIAEVPWLGKGPGVVVSAVPASRPKPLDEALPQPGQGRPVPAQAATDASDEGPVQEAGAHQEAELMRAPSIEVTAPGEHSCLDDRNPGLVADCNVLIGIRDALAKDSYELWSWDYVSPLAAWRGVTIGGAPPRITGLNLSWRSLNGRIPPEIGQLDQLTELNLAFNALDGPIPPELGRLAKLEKLALGQNALSGAIPPELGRLSNLSGLWLDGNRLSGAVPSELDELSGLQFLMLAGNELSGPFSPKLRTVPNQDLDRYLFCLPATESSPDLVGPGLLKDCTALLKARQAWAASAELNWHPSIPISSWRDTYLGGTPLRVMWLNVRHASLDGALPKELGALEELQELSLSRNGLTGAIPPELGRLSNLRKLAVDYNALSGPIPLEVTNLRLLEELWLQGNRLTGPIPEALASLHGLQVLRLGENRLTGPVPPALYRVANQRLNENLFCLPPEGLPTDWIGPGLFKDCATLLASRKALAGTTELNWRRSQSIGTWQGVVLGGSPLRVVALELGGIGLNGRIPAQLGGLDQLVSLRLSDNQLSGVIPATLGNLRNLTMLWLQTNRLSGGLSPQLLSLPKLEVLHYLSKDFDGPTPRMRQLDVGEAVSDLYCLPLPGSHPQASPGLLEDCALLLEMRDALAGDAVLNWKSSLPIDAWQGVVLGGAPVRVVALDLRGLGLNGRVPPQLVGLGGLQSLRLSDNPLQGPVPGKLANLADLDELRLGSDQDRLGAAALQEGPYCLPLPKTDFDLLKDCEALLALRDALAGDARLNWRRSTPLRSWDGLRWSGAPQRAVALDLPGRGLSGSLPPGLGALGKLDTLNLTRNRLTGSIPAELANLKSLRTLWLGENELTGSIPKALATLRLHSLALNGNRLTGTVPASWGDMPALRQLRLAGNAFTSALPSAVWDVPDHDLADDLFCLPSSMPAGDAANSALLRDCRLLLEARDALAGSANLNWRRNTPISAWHGVSLGGGSTVRVEELDLSGMQLSGRLPPELGQLTGLRELSLEGNALTGTIPPQYGKLSNLRVLRLRDNGLSGALPQQLQALGELSVLRLGGNSFAGPIPESLRRVADSDFNHPSCPLVPRDNFGLRDDCAALLAARETLDPAGVLNWSEAVPIEAWNGVDLEGTPVRVTTLAFTHQKPPPLKGRIPAELGRLEELLLLVLPEAGLSGPIPPSLGNLDRLNHLRLPGNDLSGPIPAELGRLQRLWILNLAGNRLSGPIPAELGHHRRGLGTLNLSGNRLSGPIPAELGRMKRLQRLLLRGNELTGGIPASLGNLENLHEMHLQNNALNGPIPVELGKLGRLRTLDVRHNRLTGPVPPALGAVPELRLEGNELSGDLLALPSQPLVRPEVEPRRLAGLPANEDGMAQLCRAESNGPSGNGLLKDCAILLRARDALVGGVALNWSPSMPLGIWRGVTLGGHPARVIALDLSRLGLRGTIPAQLAGLDQLVSLRLSGNALSGPIPTELGRLANLQELLLGDNALTGPVPAELANLANLQRLEFGNNRLTGPLPEALAARQGLSIEHFGGQHFGGQEAQGAPEAEAGWPAWPRGHLCSQLGQQSSDRGRDCAILLAVRDKLAGDSDLNWHDAVPVDAWRGVTLGGDAPAPSGKVISLHLAKAGLNGRIPPELANLQDLVALRLGGNALSGGIPPALGTLTHLRLLDLRDNRLSGPVPVDLQGLSELRTLRLAGNDFSGCLPPGLREVEAMDLTSAFICDPSPWGKPPLLEDAALLLGVRDTLAGSAELNWRHDEPLESWQGVRVAGVPPRVVALNLSGQGLDGRIPAELGTLDQLSWLRLNDNQLSGPIPPELGRLPHLVELAVQGNALTGRIPQQLQGLANLQELWLGDNRLTGPIPPELADIEPLWVLRLGGNDFSGCLADELRRFTTNLHRIVDLPICGQEAERADGGLGGAIRALNSIVDPAEQYSVAKSAHNLFLQMGLQTGVVGLTVLALLLAALIFGVRSRLGAEVGPTQRFVAVCIVMVVFHNVFEVYLLQNLLSVGICSWILIGMGTGEVGHRVCRAPERTDQPKPQGALPPSTGVAEAPE